MSTTARVVIFAAIIAVGAFFRFDGLAERDLWIDESCTFYAVHNLLDWPADGPDPIREVAHGPYFLLLKAWTTVAGETPLGLRSFSATVGVLTIVILGWIGTCLGGRRAGLIAAALAAVHPLHIYYSQEARVYTLWTSVAAITLYALYRAATAMRVRWWVAYGLCAWGLVLTHYYSLLWLPATIAVLFVAKDRRRVVRQWLVTHVILAVTLAPLVLFVVAANAEAGPKPWLAEIWRDYPPALAVPQSLWALLPSGAYPTYLGRLHVAGDLLAEVSRGAALAAIWAPAVLALVLLFAGGVIFRGIVERADADEPVPGAVPVRSYIPIARFLLVGGALFLLIAWLYSALISPAYVVGRYDVMALPAFVLALALLINAMPTAWQAKTSIRIVLPVAITLAFCGCGLLTVGAARAVPADHVQRDRAQRIAAHVADGDLLISMNLYRWFMAYDWHAMGFEPRIVSFPPAHDRQMCWQDASTELTDPKTIKAGVDEVAAQIEDAFAAGHRVWLLAHGEPEGARWEVDRHFFARLQALGIDVQLVDETAGLARLMPP